MNDVRPNIILSVQNADHVQEMHDYAVQNLWREHASARDEADLHRICSQARAMGMYGLADEMKKAWNDNTKVYQQETREAIADYQAANGWPIHINGYSGTI